jgi:hypothetical protein
MGATFRNLGSAFRAPRSALMKVLIANLGSTSLKWRLFDFSNGAEAMLHKGGFERAEDSARAIQNCTAAPVPRAR